MDAAGAPKLGMVLPLPKGEFDEAGTGGAGVPPNGVAGAAVPAGTGVEVLEKGDREGTGLPKEAFPSGGF